MNIIEAEDLVKGLPDQALFQEAQYPSGRIPQFLAVSEVQRRQDMRQRFQATQQGQQATVKDQILQGGIGSTGMAPEMSSAPPMAPQMPPQGAPMPPPVGMAMGGIVPYRMQEGRTVPGADNELSRLVSLRRAAMARGDSAGAAEIERRIAALNVPGGATVSQSMPNPVLTAPVTAPVSSVNTNPQDLQTRLRNLRERGARPEQIANLERQIAGLSAPPVAPAAAPPSAGQGAVSPGLPAAGAALNTPRPQAGVDTSPMGYFANLLKPYERPTEVQAAIDLQRQQMEQGLPPPIDLNQYIQSAQQRQQEARDEARQMAIANTLMNLGTGLFAGDPAAGLQRATQAATETLREGRREAQAEGRMAEQLQLQAAQQNRQNLLDNMKFRSESVNAIANIISGEEKTTRETQMQAAQVLSNYQINLRRMQNDLTVAGMGRKDIERKLESEARNRATELVLESIKGRIPDPSKPVDAQDLARQVDTITRQLLGGMDSSARATLSRADQEALNWANSNPNDERSSQIKARLGVQ
jgi:hypothetical protein